MSHRRLLLLATLALGLLPHLSTLHAGLTYDDRDFVQNNAAIQSVGAALGSFIRPFPPHQPERGLYRPLTALSYAVDHQLGGGVAWVFHATNLLLYGLTLVVIVVVLRRLDPVSDPVALIVTLLFALHPVHCEVVDSVAGRGELLALLLALLALGAFHNARAHLHSAREGAGRLGWLAASVTLYALAMLSKETAAVLPAVLVAHLALWPGASRREYLMLAPHAVVLAAYLALRIVALQGHFGPDVVVLQGAALSTRLWTMGAVFLEYIRLLVMPGVLQVDVYYEHVVGLQPHLSLHAGLGLALLLLTLVAAGIMLHRGHATRGAVFALLAMLAFLFPVSHIIPFGALMAERLIYAPSLFFILLLVLLLRGIVTRAWDRARAWRITLCAVFGLMALLLGLRGHLRGLEWRDSVTLWTSALQHVQNDPRVYNNLAAGFIERGDLQRAIRMLRLSLKLRPAHLPALNNLGYAYMQAGQLDQAERVFLAIVRADPRRHKAWNNLGVVQLRRGRPNAARRHFLRALKLNPNHAGARRNLQQVNGMIDRHNPLRSPPDGTALPQAGGGPDERSRGKAMHPL